MTLVLLVLPWPSSKLSGHNTGHWKAKSDLIASARRFAHVEARKAFKGYTLPDGDIASVVTFYPPDKRSDRLNYPNRMKPSFDGIATGLKVNDKRFLIPEYRCMEPCKNPHVLVEIKAIANGENHE